MTVRLDGSIFGNANQIHNYLANQLRLPAWYGRNLDALYDCLTELETDVTLVPVNWPETGTMGRFLQVFRDAAEENPHLSIE